MFDIYIKDIWGHTDIWKDVTITFLMGGQIQIWGVDNKLKGLYHINDVDVLTCTSTVASHK